MTTIENRRKLRAIKLGTKEKEILSLVSTGVVLAGCLVIPGLPLALAPFTTGNKHSKQNAKRSFKQLEEKDLIYLSGEKVKLTEKGKKLLKLLDSEDFKIERPDNWDKIWRIIAYDVPDTKKRERDYFRLKLEQSGFRKVQESMYVFPFECREECAVLAQNLGISPHVLYLTTDMLPRQHDYVKGFGLDI